MDGNSTGDSPFTAYAVPGGYVGAYAVPIYAVPGPPFSPIMPTGPLMPIFTPSPVTPEMLRQIIREELERLESQRKPKPKKAKPKPRKSRSPKTRR